MPKRTRDDINAALSTDLESIEQRQQQAAGESDPLMNTSVTLRSSTVNRLDRQILEKKLAGDRGFNRSRVIQALLDDYLAKLEL